MTRVLVTGGTGTLGNEVVSKLTESGYTARTMSRRPSQISTDSPREWAQADLASGDGLAAAVDGVDIVIHTASDPRNSKRVDVQGTERLLDHAENAAVERFVYVSIVGIDAWRSGWFPYYRHKLAAESAVGESTIPTSIQRATQFHSFLAGGFWKLRWAPLWPLPRAWVLQPIAVHEVAAHLVDAVEDDARGRLPDIGGPETLRFGQLASQWQTARDIRRPTISVPIPGEISALVRDGAMTTNDGVHGMETWREWLERTPTGADPRS